MIPRTLAARLQADADGYPILSLTGPRQTGKTTLVRALFPDHDYLLLEDPVIREEALSDPKGLLARRPGGVILDEAQRAPELFSYLQGIVDEEDRPGRYVLTGSNNFLLMERISQSLAGRVAVRHLLPFAMEELYGVEDRGYPPPLRADASARLEAASVSWQEAVFTGHYPRIHDKGLEAQDWLAGYVQTYLQRDVRSLVNVGDLEAFRRFLTLAAGRSGQILNQASLAADSGISHATARRWLSILEASFILVRLPVHHRNFNKRLIKSPKLYFFDTGLLCYLLRVRSPEDLEFHPARGAIFETLIVSELYKRALHRGLEPDLFFWRDSNGREVDLILERGTHQIPIEIKSGETVREDALRGLDHWRGLAGTPEAHAALIHAGDHVGARRGVQILPWCSF